LNVYYDRVVKFSSVNNFKTLKISLSRLALSQNVFSSTRQSVLNRFKPFLSISTILNLVGNFGQYEISKFRSKFCISEISKFVNNFEILKFRDFSKNFENLKFRNYLQISKFRTIFAEIPICNFKQLKTVKNAAKFVTVCSKTIKRA
jgi:hypothetical protein